MGRPTNRLTLTGIIVLARAVLALPAAAQEPPPDLAPRVAETQAVLRALHTARADAIWPGFRPDTIPAMYVVPGRGTLLAGWGEAPPEGFAPLTGAGDLAWSAATERGAASTGTQLAGRPAAQVVVREPSLADLIGRTAHEAFHVFATASARAGRRFGHGENAFLVTSYPVFDAENEAGVALEGRLLGAALDARGERRLALVRQFLAAREARHRAIGAELAEFEQQGELNEGLAEYALDRAAELAARRPGFGDTAGARRIAATARARLDSLITNVTQSLRLRFYATGPAMARLLDDLAGPGWPRQLMDEDLTLQDALAEAAGYRDAERALVRAARVSQGGSALRAAAEAGVARLRALRRAQVDSILAAPGIVLEVRADSLPGRRVGLCGIDPQNLLQVDAEVLLHTRFVRPCAGGFEATFTTPVVQDRTAGTLRAVVGADSAVAVTVDGREVSLADGARLAAATDVRIESPGVTLRAARADLWRAGARLVVRLLPD